jgi:crotonobetainyl-CoA:carnitine CoA-transferase CaiB-like acyl-CoA transferase
MTADLSRHVLDGFRVLDITQFIAGPTATRFLAQMGAEVIKLEIAPTGDRARLLPLLKDGRSSHFVHHNRGKKSLCLDMSKRQALEITKRLLARVDVFVENFSPGTIARMGFGYDEVRRINPRLVMCSISTFGQTGKLASLTGFDFIGASYAAAISAFNANREGQPVLPNIPIGDVMTGVHAVGAIACALLYRERTGNGQYLDVSLLDSYFNCHEVVTTDLHRRQMASGQGEARGTSIVPMAIFRGTRHYICIMAPQDHLWRRLCEAIGRPEMGSDPRFADHAGRARNEKQVLEAIQSWLDATDEAQALEILEKHHVPAAPVLTLADAIDNPHLLERGTVRVTNDRILGEIRVPGLPLRFSDFPDELDVQAPFLGEHNRDILKRHLEMSDAEISHLESAGILQEKRS